MFIVVERLEVHTELSNGLRRVGFELGEVDEV